MELNKRQERVLSLFTKPPLLWLIEPHMYGVDVKELRNNIYEQDKGKFNYDVRKLQEENIIKRTGGFHTQYYLTKKGNKLRKKLNKGPLRLEKIVAIFFFSSIASFLFLINNKSLSGFFIFENLNNSKTLLFFPALFFVIAIFFLVKLLRNK